MYIRAQTSCLSSWTPVQHSLRAGSYSNLCYRLLKTAFSAAVSVLCQSDGQSGRKSNRLLFNNAYNYGSVCGAYITLYSLVLQVSTVYCIPCILQTVHNIHYTLPSKEFVLKSAYLTIYTTYRILQTVHYTLYTEQFLLDNIQPIMKPVISSSSESDQKAEFLFEFIAS